LTDRYVKGIPADARASKPGGSLSATELSAGPRAQITALNGIAKDRGQSLAQLALAWTLRHASMTSTLIGASRIAQLEENLGALRKLHFEAAELAQIDQILASGP
jgi:L-glyceraldehyde 3-phosphate reductase